MNRWRVVGVGVLAAIGGFVGQAKAADESGPKIVHEPIVDAVEGEPIVVRARIVDRSGVFAPAVYVRAKGTKKYVTLKMKRRGGKQRSAYEAMIPAEQVAGEVEYFIEAFDRLGNGPSRVGQPRAPLVIRTYSPLPPSDASVSVAKAPEAEPPPVEKIVRPRPLPPLPTPTADPPPPDVSVAVPALSDDGDDDGIVDQWWFWTLIGLAVAGAATGVTFLVLDDSGPVDAVTVEVRAPDPTRGLQ